MLRTRLQTLVNTLWRGSRSPRVTEPRFYKLESQTPDQRYWGTMSLVGHLGDGCFMMRVEFAPRVAHARHRHPRHDELIYVLSGRLEQVIEGTNGEIHKESLEVGEAAVIPRRMVHSGKPLLDGTKVLIVLRGTGDSYESEELGNAVP